MSNNVVIGMLGKRGAGKDTVADYLVEKHGFTRIAFADKLRQEVAEKYGVPVTLFDVRGWKERERVAVDGYIVLGGKSPREVLQVHGTARRAQDADYWTRQVFDRIAAFPGNYVISDVRMPNEFEGVLAAGGLAVRVSRPVLEAARNRTSADAHDSEVALDGHTPDHVLVNREGDKADLYGQIERVLDSLSAVKAA